VFTPVENVSQEPIRNALRDKKMWATSNVNVRRGESARATTNSAHRGTDSLLVLFPIFPPSTKNKCKSCRRTSVSDEVEDEEKIGIKQFRNYYSISCPTRVPSNDH